MKKICNEFFWLGALFGFIAATTFLFLIQISMLDTNEQCCEFEQPIIGCGRGFVDECPNACYDQRSGAFLRFEHTSNNLNIIIEKER